MKVLKAVKRVLWEIFDFFCGDWWNLIGLAVTVLILFAIDKFEFLAFLQPANFILYPVLIGLTLMFALNKAAKK
ncbi:MAG: hypothetical protein FWD71_05525 [Oscillospiraceae bacterium]|nr:hypothetical protein [Oscillospiraceae bacterium]